MTIVEGYLSKVISIKFLSKKLSTGLKEKKSYGSKIGMKIQTFFIKLA